MSSPNKSTGEEVDHKEDNGEHEEQQNPDSPLKSDQSGLSENFEKDSSDDGSDQRAKDALLPKRQSGSISGERSNLEDSPSTPKKSKQEESPQRQKRNSTSGEKDSSGGSTLKKAKEAADSARVSPSFVRSPNESPSTPPPQSFISPVKGRDSPILHALLQQGSNASPTSGLSARTESIEGNLTQPLPTDSVIKSQGNNSPGSNPTIVSMLNQPRIDHPSIAGSLSETLPIDSVTQPRGTSFESPSLILDMLSRPPFITPSPSLAAAIDAKFSNLSEEKADTSDMKKSPLISPVKSDPLSCGAQEASDFNIPPQTSGHHDATEPMNESVSDPSTETKDDPDKKEVYPEESSPEETTEDVNISSLPQSSSLAIAAPEPELPSSQPTPTGSSEVSLEDSTAKHSNTTDRLQKMSDNLKGINLEDSSKSITPGRHSKRLQEAKKSSGDDGSTRAREASIVVPPKDEVFKKPSATPIKPKIKTRMDDMNLEDSNRGASPSRRSARNKGIKESGASSKESASLQKEKEGKNLRPKPGGRAASDERTDESGKSKSLSRERIAKLKTESGSRERVKTEGEASKTRSREDTPKPKNKDTSQTGSREHASSGEGVARRTRNQSRTASSNSEADKTDEDENETAKDKRKSRKDSSK